MKVIFACAAARKVSYVDGIDTTVKNYDFPNFLPSESEFRELKSRKFEFIFLEPRVPFFSISAKDVERERKHGQVVTSVHDAKLLINPDEDMIFVDCGGSRSIPEFLKHTGFEFYSSAVYIFLAPHTPSTELKTLKIPEKKTYDFVHMLSSDDFIDFAGCFDPFREFKFYPEDWIEIEKKHNFEFLEELCVVASNFIKMGFLEENISPFPEFEKWTCNLFTSPMILLQKHFGIYSPFEHRKNLPIDEFCERANFRKLLTEYVCKVLANIAVDNKIYSRKTNWTSAKTYSSLAKELKKFILE